MEKHAYRDLALGIIHQAVMDYKGILRDIKYNRYVPSKEYYDLREFFKSDWFYALSWGLEGDYVLKQFDQLQEGLAPPKPQRAHRPVTDEEANMIVVMHDVEMMTFSEIAGIARRNAGTIFNVYKRTKERMGVS